MGPALVIGGASCVWHDIEAALTLGEFFAVIACNDIGTAWAGDLDAWVTLHPENMQGWTAQRAARGYRPAKKIVYHEAKGGTPPADLITPYNWHRSHKSASSGLFAAKAALELGFDRLVLCGVPLTMTPHFNNTGEWHAASGFHDGLRSAVPFLKDKVRSMSGMTRQELGVPTPEWLAGRRT
jgi:hypothetical protein